LRTGKSISVGFPNVLITLRRDEKPSRRSVMSTIIDSPVLTPSPPTFAHRMPGYAATVGQEAQGGHAQQRKRGRFGNRRHHRLHLLHIRVIRSAGEIREAVSKVQV